MICVSSQKLYLLLDLLFPLNFSNSYFQLIALSHFAVGKPSGKQTAYLRLNHFLFLFGKLLVVGWEECSESLKTTTEESSETKLG